MTMKQERFNKKNKTLQYDAGKEKFMLNHTKGKLTCASSKDGLPFAAIVSGLNLNTPSVNTEPLEEDYGEGGGGGVGSPGTPVEGMYFMHTDHLNSVTAITDPKGEMVASMDIDSGKSIISYKPYGEIDRKNSSGPDIFRYKYTGQEEDRETGLYYYKARYYDPKIGRFLQPDTYLHSNTAFGMNPYMYVDGNPIMYNDPSGHSKLSAWMKKRGLGRFNFNLRKISFNKMIGRQTGYQAKTRQFTRRFINNLGHLYIYNHCQNNPGTCPGPSFPPIPPQPKCRATYTDYVSHYSGGSPQYYEKIIPESISNSINADHSKPQEYDQQDGNLPKYNISFMRYDFDGNEHQTNADVTDYVVVRTNCAEAYPWDICVEGEGPDACTYTGGELHFPHAWSYGYPYKDSPFSQIYYKCAISNNIQHPLTSFMYEHFYFSNCPINTDAIVDENEYIEYWDNSVDWEEWFDDTFF